MSAEASARLSELRSELGLSTPEAPKQAEAPQPAPEAKEAKAEG